MDHTSFLKTDGTVLKDHSGKGDAVILRGTNAGGWLVQEAWMCPTNSVDQKSTIRIFTERFGKERAEELLAVYENHWWTLQDFDNAKELGFNVLRLPFAWFHLLDDEGKLRAETLAKLDWFVENCAKRDMYVILDLHGAPGSQNGRDHSGDTSGSVLYKDENAKKRTVSLWEQLAEHYKGNPAIAGYDLLNEPEGDETERAPWGEKQLPFFDELYRAVRRVDGDHIIIMNAVWEPADMPHTDRYGWENVIYQYHFYGWDGIDDVEEQKRFTDSKVVMEQEANHQVPVLVGEFTLFEEPESWKYALKVYEEQGWSWTTWTYKCVEMGWWGIYRSTRESTPGVDVNRDSYEEIAEKWSRVDTASGFVKNQEFAEILRTFAAG